MTSVIKFIKRYLSIKKNLNLINTYWNYYNQTALITNHHVIGFIDPIAVCNLKCPGCATGLRLPDRHKGVMGLEKFKGLIDENGDYLFALTMFNWGEPMLHHDLPEMIKYASDRGIYTTISSNFSIKLSDEYIKKIVRSGLDVLYLSIDGITQDSYSHYRRGGNLEVVLKNLKRIHDIRLETGCTRPVLKWKFIVFKHNEHEIEEVRKNYKSLGADELIIVGGCIPTHSGIEPPVGQMYAPLQFSKSSNTRTCSFLYGSFVYNSDGLISPCCGLPSIDFDFSIYDGNMMDAINSEKFIKARQFFKDNTIHYGNIGSIDGLKLNTKLHGSGIICMQCPTPSMQDGMINIIPFLLDDILGMISSKHQEYIRTKWKRLKKVISLKY